jgi:magnesium chelatase subunit D
MRGGGPVRDALLEYVRDHWTADAPLLRLPINVDGERLLGGVDLTATLAAGRRIMRPGLLPDARGGAVIVAMAERLGEAVAAPLAQMLDRGALAVVLIDDGEEADEAPPAILVERCAFSADLSALRAVPDCAIDAPPVALHEVAPLSVEQRGAIAHVAAALGIVSTRALIFADRAARGCAALAGRTIVGDDDVAAAVRLVLSHRATRVPEAAPPPEPPPPDHAPPSDDAMADNHEQPAPSDADLEDIVLAAALAAIPKHVLDQLSANRRGGNRGRGGRAGQKQQSARRGRPLSARIGVPGHGKRLALIDTLRAAAPWQRLRRATALPGRTDHVQIRKSDLRVRAFEQRRESLTIFAVDASGSSALARLAEAKGAVELMLAEAYVKRAEVALVAFRQAGAEVLLPPTRSLTRARRALAALPGGGGTPLAAGLIAARQLAEAGMRCGQSPVIALLTDGKANVRLDGGADREGAMAEVSGLARSMAAAGLASIVIDISPRPRPEAAELAAALGGRYLPLPSAHSAAMVAAIGSVNDPAMSR